MLTKTRRLWPPGLLFYRPEFPENSSKILCEFYPAACPKILPKILCRIGLGPQKPMHATLVSPATARA